MIILLAKLSLERYMLDQKVTHIKSMQEVIIFCVDDVLSKNQ